MTAAAAAKIILDGVKAERWRILVGDDAHRLDKRVRQTPERPTGRILPELHGRGRLAVRVGFPIPFFFLPPVHRLIPHNAWREPDDSRGGCGPSDRACRPPGVAAKAEILGAGGADRPTAAFVAEFEQRAAMFADDDRASGSRVFVDRPQHLVLQPRNGFPGALPAVWSDAARRRRGRASNRDGRVCRSRRCG